MTYRTPKTRELENDIKTLHGQGARQFEIAKKLEISRGKVRYHLRKLGLVQEPSETLVGSKKYRSENHPNYKLVAKYLKHNYGSKRISELSGLKQSHVIFWMRKIRKGTIKDPLHVKDHQDRRTLEGFRKYMTENPVYFKDRFQGMTIDEAYRDAHGLARKCKNGEAAFFLEGIPEHREQTDYSVGYGDR